MTKTPSSSPPLSKDKEDEELRDSGHSMSIGNPILGASSVTVSYLIHYDSLLQNVTDIITKCNSYFITKCFRFFIRKCDSFIIKCDSYYKLRPFHSKMRRLLQITTVQPCINACNRQSSL